MKFKKILAFCLGLVLTLATGCAVLPSPTAPAPTLAPGQTQGPTEASGQALAPTQAPGKTREPPTVTRAPEYSQTLSFLFVGNSFTYVCNVPKQFAGLAHLYGVEVIFDMICPGGATLDKTRAQVIEALGATHYDYLVIQDAGGRPVYGTRYFLNDVKKLCEEARAQGTIPVLYSPGFAHLADNSPDREYQTAATAAHCQAAQENDALLINAGDAWVYAHQKMPDLLLYEDETGHATPAGAYLTACVAVSTLFGFHVKDIPAQKLYHGSIALELGQAAWEFVTYDQTHDDVPESAVTVADGDNQRVND